MAVVTHRGGAGDTGNAATYTTASVTVPSGELAVVIAAITGSAATDWVLTDSLGGTWSKILRAVKNTSADFQELWIRNSLSNGSAMTLTFAHASGNATGFIYECASATGMTRTGASAVRQSVKVDNRAASTTPTVTFASAVLTGNPTLFGMHLTSNVNTSVITGWTLLANSTYSTPAAQVRSFKRDSGFTGTTITASSTAAEGSDLAVELDTSAGATSVSGSDSATGTDAGTASVTAAGSQAATGTDTGTVSATASGNDSATGTDAGLVAAAVVDSDAGTATDAGTVEDVSGGPTLLSDSDSGAGTDAGTVLDLTAPEPEPEEPDLGDTSSIDTIHDFRVLSDSDHGVGVEGSALVDVTPPEPLRFEPFRLPALHRQSEVRRLFDGDVAVALEAQGGLVVELGGSDAAAAMEAVTEVVPFVLLADAERRERAARAEAELAMLTLLSDD